MTNEPRELQRPLSTIRNTPMSQRDWSDLLDGDDVAAIESDAGGMVLALEDGQVNLHYGFANLEELRVEFVPMWEELHSELESFEANYVRIDLIQLPDRTWIEPLLTDISFQPNGEWMEMVITEVDPNMPPPEFPDGVAMRRGGPDDADRIVEIESEGYGDYSDGEAATRVRVEQAGWIGILEDNGEAIGYAINDDIENARGRVLSAAVEPDAWGNGYGELVLAAATYQLIASEARSVSVVVRPEVGQALRATQALGYRPGLRGIEWRRTTDEEAIEERLAQIKERGVKARFGNWR